mmetsp:Transcript_17966/g.26351  ORF Transcript_17966/g.26351 Transcript_17966/m.26351 type:complete len:250 (+) Transcript_17966:172-921(+)
MGIVTKRVVVVIICALVVSSDAGSGVHLRGAAHRVALDDEGTLPDDEGPPIVPPAEYDTDPDSEQEEGYMSDSLYNDPGEFSTWTQTETSRLDPWEIETFGNVEEQHDNQMPSPNNLQSKAGPSAEKPIKDKGPGGKQSGYSSSGVKVASSNQEIDPNAEIPVMEVPVVEDTLSTFDEELGYYPELPVTGDETVLKDDEEYYFPPVWDEYASANNISSNDESFDGDPFEGAMEAPEGEGAGNEGLEDVV